MNEKVREALERAERWMGDCTELATIRAHIEGLEAARDAGADLDCDDRRDDADFWWNVAAFRAVELGRQIERAEAAEARVRELEADARRYRFLRDDPPNSLCVRIDREGCAAIYTDGDILDAAIDSAMQESRDG
jgi:hypothetical protein